MLSDRICTAGFYVMRWREWIQNLTSHSSGASASARASRLPNSHMEAAVFHHALLMPPSSTPTTSAPQTAPQPHRSSSPTHLKARAWILVEAGSSTSLMDQTSIAGHLAPSRCTSEWIPCTTQIYKGARVPARTSPVL